VFTFRSQIKLSQILKCFAAETDLTFSSIGEIGFPPNRLGEERYQSFIISFPFTIRQQVHNNALTHFAMFLERKRASLSGMVLQVFILALWLLRSSLPTFSQPTPSVSASLSLSETPSATTDGFLFPSSVAPVYVSSSSNPYPTQTQTVLVSIPISSCAGVSTSSVSDSITPSVSPFSCKSEIVLPKQK